MRVIVGSIVAAALIWSGYWAFAAHGVRAQIESAVAANPDISVGDWQLGGFPYRFELDAREVAFVTPDGAHGWQGPRVALTALAYKPQHLIATFPAESRLRVLGLDMDLGLGEGRASVIVQPGLRLDLDRANLALDQVALKALGLTHSADALRLALRADGAALDVALEVTAITPDALILPVSEVLPAMIGRFGLDAQLTLSAPVALAAPSPNLTEITLRAIVLDWGDLKLSGTGTLRPDGPGTFGGDVALSVQNWPKLLGLLTASGALEPEMLGMAQMMLAGMADPATGGLTLPLSLRASQVFLGPFPLGSFQRL
ncbi:MAG: DUF2125 domain-containing protein [Roseinatronobacter sp.]